MTTFEHAPGVPAAAAVVAYVDGDLSEAEEIAFEDHLDRCAECRSLLAQAEVLLPALAKALPRTLGRREPPEETEAELAAALVALRARDRQRQIPSPLAPAPSETGVAERPRRGAGPRWAQRTWLVASAVAAVVALILIVNLLRGPAEPLLASPRQVSPPVLDAGPGDAG